MPEDQPGPELTEGDSPDPEFPEDAEMSVDPSADTVESEPGSEPPAAVRMTKRLLRNDTPGLDERMRDEFGLFVQRLQSPEFVEAVTAFMEKRPPRFDAMGES